MSEVKIYCPKCTWKPLPSSRWICTERMGGCGHRWNTFTTGGICPKCNYVWNITSCATCKQFTLHVEWYHYPEPPDEQTLSSEKLLEGEVCDA
jgi:hypothetical protein